MRAVIQRVKEASVRVDDALISNIESGLLVFLGVGNEDNQEDADWLATKIISLRILDDENGNMNLSLLDLSLEILVVSQFTLFGSTRKGNRPSYLRAAAPDIANQTYLSFINLISQKINREVQKGVFGANMQISLVNDGPVTIIIDTKNRE